jgi:nitrosocyanin
MKRFLPWALGFILAAAPVLAGETRELTLLNIKYQGKVMWLPGTIVVKKGDHVKLTLLNNVPEDPAVHGFTIPEFGVKAEAARGVPTVVEFDAVKSGLFDTSCHLHPAHLKGQLLVVD